MSFSSESKNKITRYLDTAIVYGICLYIAIMFLSKGEGIRNILLYGSFFLWFFVIKKSTFKKFVKEPITILYIIFAIICQFSVFYSIDPLDSLNALRENFIKSIVLFPIIATIFNSEKKIKRMIFAFVISALLIVINGYITYFTTDISIFKPNTKAVHLWHNQFARYLNTYLPFIFSLLILSRNRIYKYLLLCLLIFSVLGLILSTSRGGYISFLAITVIWTVFLIKENKPHLKKIAALLLLSCSLITVISLATVPKIRERLTAVESINERVNVWIPVIEAIKQRPLSGWGFGSEIIKKEEPYLKTPYEAPDIGMHNTFLKIAFTTGIVGLGSYLCLLIYTAFFCWKNAVKEKKQSFKSYIFVSVFSVIVGNYFFHSMTEVVSFLLLSIILGIAVTTKNSIGESVNPK